MRVGAVRRAAAFLVAAVTVVSTSVVAWSPGPAGASPPPQTFGGDFPDPALVQDGSTYYAYSTNIFVFGVTLNVPVATSPDLATWTYQRDAFPTIGSWAASGRTWAPEVRRWGTGWALFYTAMHAASGRQCIGHATAASPLGPFVDPHPGPIVCQLDRAGSIDPSVHLGDAGPVLLWKSEDDVLGGTSTIWSAPLAADGGSLIGPATPLLSAAAGSWHRRTIEAPAMIRTGAELLLLYSGGAFGSSDYAMGYARCASVTGPCTDRTTGAPWVSTANTGIVGPGGGSILERPGAQPVLAFHGWVGAVGYPNGSRAMYVQLLDLTGGVPWIPAIRPSGNRHLRDAASSGPATTVLTFGQPGDVQLACDWDGDGIDTPGVFRGGRWYLRTTNTSGVADASFVYGDPGDRPLCGDWDGDGDDTPGVARGGMWYLRNSATTGTADVAFAYGDPTDTPVTGDWDADGDDTVGVVRRGTWYLRNSTTTGVTDVAFGYGDPTDAPVTGDWDADGDDSPGIVRRGTWHLRNSATTGIADIAFGYGDPTDKPITGDWDGDGDDTPGITR